MSYDLVIKNGTVVDGSGMPRFRADVGIAGGKIASIGKIQRECEGRHRCRRPRRVAGHHRRAHAYGCAGVLGSHGDLLVLARHHVGRDGQLRLLAGAVRGEGQAAGDAQPRARRGHRARGDGGRNQVVVGDLSAVPRRGRSHAQGNQLHRLHRAFGAAHLRDGRARVRARSDRRRTRRDEARTAHRRFAPARSASRPRARATIRRPTVIRSRAASRTGTKCGSWSA